jgi:uncharacterized membrane protein
MPFCASCGSSVEGKFCPKCGAAVAGAAAPPPPGGGYSAGGYAPPPPPPPPQTINAAGIPSNIAALLCYIIPVICPIIFLVVEPYKSDRKVRFDAFQSIFLSVAFFVANIAWGIIIAATWRFTSLFFLGSLLHLAELAIMIFMAFKAYQNEKFVLPIIGPLAEKQA